MKLSRFTILHKGLLVIGIPLLYQALFIGLLLKRQHQHNEGQWAATHTEEVLLQIDRMYRSVVESENNLRGYLLLGEDVLRQELERATLLAGTELSALRQLAANKPKQQSRFARVEACVQKRSSYQQTILDVLHTRGREEAVATARKLNGPELLESLQKEVKAFRTAEEKLDRERLETLRKSSFSQTALLLSGLVITVIVGAGVAVLFSREISGRILVLTENTHRMARGESLPKLVHGSDEVAELDVQFHHMAEELASAREREQGYQQTLERRATELTDANRELDQKSRENEMFVYSVSHDLRSPLVNLQGFSKELDLARQDLAQLLAGPASDGAIRKAQRITEQDIGESINYIQAAVTRLSGIIDALLRLSRAGRVEYHFTEVDLVPIMNRIIGAMRSTIIACGATVTVDPLPTVRGDATAIEQIFANLIGNAVNYLDPSRPGRIEIGAFPAETPDGLQTFYVKDNGLGIAAAYLPKVFAAFQRLHANVAPGEGIGLALVHRVVERHGGRIWVESEEGVGSTFCVALPAIT